MHVAVIGGGFSGAACVLHLLRDHPAFSGDITMIEPRAVLGAGLAYSAASPVHRTNVAASRMSVLPDNPSHFHDWLLDEGVPARDPACAMPDGRLYPARAEFGRYVDTMLRREVARHDGAAFRHVRAAAIGASREGDRVAIALAGHPSFLADIAVLAVSHTAPDVPAALANLSCVVADPWDVAALNRIAPGARVLVVGTGLTACDVMAHLLARGHRGRIDAVSRHGLLPRPRTTLPVEAEGDFSGDPETCPSALLRRIRRAVEVAREGGRPWENIVDALRQQAGAAWGALDWEGRRRVLRHLRTVWDVHRFQSAPQIDAALARARADGVLHVRAARVVGARDLADDAEIILRPRGAAECESLRVDAVVNCTGPGHRSVTHAHPVLRGLAEAGLLQPDPANLGIWVDGDSRVVRADGAPWTNLFVAGPLARGTFGELMGLPQVNLQPRAIAASVAELARAA